MAQSNCEADKMLDVYIHDYLLKRKLIASANTFMTEGKVATDPQLMHQEDSSLNDGLFSGTYSLQGQMRSIQRLLQAQQIKASEQQQLQMQQRNAQLQHRDPNHPALGGSINAINSEGVMGQHSASVLAMKMYKERMKHPQSMDSETSPALIDANRMALLKSAANPHGQLVQSNSGNMPAALQQIQGRTPLTTGHQ